MAGYRRFCNKIYQATKYVLGNLPSSTSFTPLPVSAKSASFPAPTGRESLAERWILHKLTIAARDINKALTEREFSRATQVAYAYWYYHLCDVYIENSKSIIKDGTPEEQLSAVNTLYTALDAGLTMIHPFMPFLTEELWQRLPRRQGDSCPTILRAQYPEYDAALLDTEAEAAYELVLACSKGIRSLLSEYAIKEGATAYVLPLSSAAHATAAEQQAAIRTLAGPQRALASLTILAHGADKPKGCAVFPVSADAAVYVHVKDLIDVDAEIEKAKAKLARASETVRKNEKTLESVEEGGRKGDVSEAVVQSEREKVRDGRAEVRALEEAVQQFHELKLE